MDLLKAEELAQPILSEYNVDLDRWSFQISGSCIKHAQNFNRMGWCSNAWPEKYGINRGIYLDLPYTLTNGEEWLKNTLHHEIIHSKVADFQESFNVTDEELGGAHGTVFQKFAKIYGYDYGGEEDFKKTLHTPIPNWLAFCKYCDKSFYINRIDKRLIKIKCRDCNGNYGGGANFSWVRTFYFDKGDLTEEIKEIVQRENSVIWRPTLNFSHNIHGITDGEINGEIISELSLHEFNTPLLKD